MNHTNAVRAHVIDETQVNIPYAMLNDGYRELFLEKRLNPEIGVDAVLDDIPLPAVERIADAFHAAGRTITLHGPFTDLSPVSPDRGIRELSGKRLYQILPLIPILRPRTVVCHAGYDWRRYGYFRQDWVADSIAFWRAFGSRLSAAGTQLVLENVYESDPGDVLPLAEALAPDGIRWCLDIGHLHAFGNGRLEQWLDALDPYIAQMHLHDNAMADDDHLALGAGGIDMDRVMAYLRGRERNRPILTLEPHNEADLEGSLGYLETHWPWPVPGLSG